MDENEIDSRYLRKMRNLIREGTHIARINDLLERIKAKLPELEELLAESRTTGAKKTAFTGSIISRSRSSTCKTRSEKASS
jgi:hypothetical protein